LKKILTLLGGAFLTLALIILHSEAEKCERADLLIKQLDSEEFKKIAAARELCKKQSGHILTERDIGYADILVSHKATTQLYHHVVVSVFKTPSTKLIPDFTLDCTTNLDATFVKTIGMSESLGLHSPGSDPDKELEIKIFLIGADRKMCRISPFYRG